MKLRINVRKNSGLNLHLEGFGWVVMLDRDWRLEFRLNYIIFEWSLVPFTLPLNQLIHCLMILYAAELFSAFPDSDSSLIQLIHVWFSWFTVLFTFDSRLIRLIHLVWFAWFAWFIWSDSPESESDSPDSPESDSLDLLESESDSPDSPESESDSPDLLVLIHWLSFTWIWFTWIGWFT